MSQAGFPVTVAIASAGGSLSGSTTTVNTNASGVATFTNLRITGLVGIRTLSFGSTGLTGATSSNVNLTSGMIAGSRSALVTAWQLLFFVLGVIAQSVGTAVFPSLSALAAANDIIGFKDRLAGAIFAFRIFQLE